MTALNNCNLMAYRPAAELPGHVRTRIDGLARMRMERIPVSGPIVPGFAILEAYLGKDSTSPWFGMIKTVVQHYDMATGAYRYFLLDYHVWKPNQRPVDANRLSNLMEIICKDVGGVKCSDITHPDDRFGWKAFWMRTPDADIDREAKALRAIGRHLKRYSVENGLCKYFRKTYKDILSHKYLKEIV